MAERILVVDDEDTIRMILTEVLEEDGFDVTAAKDGTEALEAFRRERFPVVLTDIYMGKMTGIDLLQEIKLLDEEALVVIMTSNASLDTATSALRSGAYDYLTKPFDELDRISTVVGRAVERSRLLRDNRSLMDRLQSNAAHLEALNRQLRETANRDGLTGLFNHRYFREGLEVEISRSTRHGHVFSLIFMDIDHFKKFNDTNGHLIGDKLLKDLAGILRRSSRESTLVARYGGEEFVMVLPETDTAGAMIVAEGLRTAIEQHAFDGRQNQPGGRITLSSGVSSFPEDGADASTLIERADRALYQAKHDGRNVVRCWKEIADSLPDEETA